MRLISRPTRLIRLVLPALVFTHLLQAELALEDYPLVDHLVLGAVPVKVQATRQHTFYAAFSGPVEQIVARPVGTAKAGELLLFQDRERMDIETRLLAIERQLTEKQEIPEQQLALFQSLRQIENREAEIGQQLAFIKEIENNPELSRLFAEGAEGPGIDKEAAFDRLELERRVTQRILQSLEQPEVRKLAEELVNLQLRKRELEHEKRLREARITMPFDGTYRVLLPSSAGADEMVALQGEPLVQVEDLSTVLGLVEIHGVRWRTLPRENLQLRIPRMASISREYRGQFRRALLSERERDGALIYVFAFDGEAREPAARIRGGTVTGEILLDLSAERYRLIPKLTLLEAYPEAFEHSWESGVRASFDDVREVHVGRDGVAILIGEDG